MRKNLYREARILAQLRHPNIIRLFETLKANSLYCLVTEYAGGGEMLSFLRMHKDNRLTETQAWPFVRQLISALCYLHERGVVHRDLKMENIMLDEKKKNLKLVDFGLSNTFTADELLKTHCGSPEYAAPELFVVGKTYGPEIDIWSLGINMYAIVVGKLPFSTPYSDEYRRHKLLQQIQKGLSTQHEKEMSHLSTDCRSLLRQLIEPTPELRLPLAEVQTHPWVTKANKQPFYQYQQVAKDRVLRKNVIEELSRLLDTEVSKVEKTVHEYRSDELSAMYNMMIEARRKEKGTYDVDHTMKKSTRQRLYPEFPRGYDRSTRGGSLMSRCSSYSRDSRDSSPASHGTASPRKHAMSPMIPQDPLDKPSSCPVTVTVQFSPGQHRKGSPGIAVRVAMDETAASGTESDECTSLAVTATYNRSNGNSKIPVPCKDSSVAEENQPTSPTLSPKHSYRHGQNVTFADVKKKTSHVLQSNRTSRKTSNGHTQAWMPPSPMLTHNENANIDFSAAKASGAIPKYSYFVHSAPFEKADAKDQQGARLITSADIPRHPHTPPTSPQAPCNSTSNLNRTVNLPDDEKLKMEQDHDMTAESEEILAAITDGIQDLNVEEANMSPVTNTSEGIEKVDRVNIQNRQTDVPTDNDNAPEKQTEVKDSVILHDNNNKAKTVNSTDNKNGTITSPPKKENKKRTGRLIPVILPNRKPMHTPIATVESLSEDSDGSHGTRSSPDSSSLLLSNLKTNVSKQANSVSNKTKTLSSNDVKSPVPDLPLRLEPQSPSPTPPAPIANHVVDTTSIPSTTGGSGNRVHPLHVDSYPDSPNIDTKVSQPGFRSNIPRATGTQSTSSSPTCHVQRLDKRVLEYEQKMKSNVLGPPSKFMVMRQYDQKRRHMKWRQGLSHLLRRSVRGCQSAEERSASNSPSPVRHTKSNVSSTKMNSNRPPSQGSEYYKEMAARWTASPSPTNSDKYYGTDDSLDLNS